MVSKIEVSDNNIKLDPAEKLPAEVVIDILSYLENDSKSLGRCSELNKTWYALSNQNYLWKRVAKNLDIPVPKDNKDVKNYLSKKIYSPEKFLEFLKEYINNIQADSSKYLQAILLNSDKKYEINIGNNSKALTQEIESDTVFLKLKTDSSIKPWTRIIVCKSYIVTQPELRNKDMPSAESISDLLYSRIEAISVLNLNSEKK